MTTTTNKTTTKNTISKEALVTLQKEATKFKSEVLNETIALDRVQKFFADVKSAKRWTDEVQVNVARWIAYKWLKNRYAWNGLPFLFKLMQYDIVKDYSNFNSFVNPADIGGEYQEAYNVFAIVHDVLISYDVRTWKKLTSETEVGTIEKATRRTFSLGATPSVKEVSKDVFGMIYHALNENMKLYGVESLDAIYSEEKALSESVSAIEVKEFESVFTSLYVVPKTGQTTIESIDVSPDTMEALETIATKCNLSEMEKLALLFIGACKLSVSKAMKCYCIYTNRSTRNSNKFRSAFDNAMKKLESVGYSKDMF